MKISQDPKHIFVTSDHHFGAYALTIPFFRVFTRAEEDTLIEKWNSVVRPGDTVLYVGDFADCGVAGLMEYRQRLNGDIVLVKGNHDRDEERVPNFVYESAFQGVYEDELVLDEFDLVLRHEPKDAPDADGRLQIFGHEHRNRSEPPFLTESSYCCCVQFHDGYPVSLEKILMEFQKRKERSEILKIEH